VFEKQKNFLQVQAAVPHLTLNSNGEESPLGSEVRGAYNLTKDDTLQRRPTRMRRPRWVGKGELKHHQRVGCRTQILVESNQECFESGCSKRVG
jgi:hypothetical protein